MTLFPSGGAAIKGRVLASFPATVEGSGGIGVSKSSGVWTIEPSWDDLAVETTLADASERELWIYNPDTDVYTRLSVQYLLDNLPAGPSGDDGSLIFQQNSAPATDKPANSIWIDADSADLDVYQLISSVWTDTGINLKGATGATGASYAATSTSSQAIGNSGTKTFTTQAGLAYQVGTRIRAADASNPTANWMEGVVTSYSSTTLAFTADKSLGSGTLTNWTLSVAGQFGADGAGVGDVVGPSASVDSELALFNSTSGKLIKRASLTGLVKATSGVASTASAGTDYLAPPSGSAVLKANSGGALANASDGTDYLSPTTGLAQGKHTIWVPVAAMTPRTTNGAAAGSVELSSNKQMFKTLDFDTSTQEFAQFAIHMPKSWNESTVTFQPVWSHASTTTNFGVVWALEAVALSDDDAGDASFGTAQTSTDTGGTTNDIYIGPESSAITIGGSPAENDYVIFQVKRVPSDGSDTMAIDARLHGIKVLFSLNAATDA